MSSTSSERRRGKRLCPLFPKLIDHAVLKPDSTRADIEAACALGRKHALGSICVQPFWAPVAAELLQGGPTPVSSVAGFPLGCNSTAAKVADADYALRGGAREIDMVHNISALKSGRHDLIRQDIAAVVACAREHRAIVKVILEMCYLTEEEKVRAAELAVEAGAAFVKTSTGLGPGGATVEDVVLLRRAVPATVGVKAAGGIRSLADLLAMVEAGANRIGTSATEAILGELG